MPQGGLDALEKQDPLTILAYQYTSSANGYEIASGAIRNHVPEIMYKAFALAGHPKEVVDTEFAGMINAFSVRRAAPRRHRARHRPHRHAAGQRIEHPRSHRLPHGAERSRPPHERPAPVSDKQLRDVHLAIRKPRRRLRWGRCRSSVAVALRATDSVILARVETVGLGTIGLAASLITRTSTATSCRITSPLRSYTLHARGAVAFGAVIERLLRRGHVFVPAGPGVEGGLLDGAE